MLFALKVVTYPKTIEIKSNFSMTVNYPNVK